MTESVYLLEDTDTRSSGMWGYFSHLFN